MIQNLRQWLPLPKILEMAVKLFQNLGPTFHKLLCRVFEGEPLVRQNEFAMGLASM